MNTAKEKNNLLKSINDEIEFIQTRKSIQFHENQTNEEIESKLYKQKNNNNNNKSFNLKDLLKYDETNKENKKRNKYNLFNPKDNEEQQIEKIIKYKKYLSRKTYEDIHKKNSKKITCFMLGSMIIIYILYLIGLKYNESIIKKFLDILLIQD